ncbi:Adenine nucleotide alpha hydrolase superfamily protein [Trifolium repens]|nr:Adenine nucleotide alpha hydrolase superfamily protein [Trifolium repens]
MASGNGSNRNPHATNISRKVLVVADPTRESAGALQYALCHAVMEQDELILLHVIENIPSWRNTLSTFLKMPSLGTSMTASLGDFGGGGGGAGGGGGGGGGSGAEGETVIDFLEEMKNACKVSQPKLKVRVMKVETDNGKDRANTILSYTINQEIDVVVIGQKRTLSSTLLGYKRPTGGSLKGAKMIDTAEYLIHNTPGTCTCVAVQRKANGGYVLNTKTHRNFWLLA